MALLFNGETVKTKRRWIRLTEWPQSLVSAYRAGILGGQAEELGRAMDAMNIYRNEEI